MRPCVLHCLLPDTTITRFQILLSQASKHAIILLTGVTFHTSVLAQVHIAFCCQYADGIFLILRRILLQPKVATLLQYRKGKHLMQIS